MNFGQSFRLAIKSLTTSKMRALLTMLGIIIGVGAVIVILSLGNGLTGMVQQQVDKLGINMIQAQFFGGTADRLPDPEDMYDMVEANADILTGVSPYLGVNAVVRHGSDKFDRTSLYGVSEIMYNAATGYTIDGEQLAKGRFISYMDVERRENICVIGAYLEEEAFGGDALGKQLSINGLPLTVVGVLKRNAELEMLPGSQDDQIYIPYTTALEIMGSRWVNLYIFTSTSGETADAGKRIIEAYLNDFFRTDDGMYNYFYIMTMAEQANQINAMLGKLEIKAEFRQGQRITDDATMNVVEMVLAGSVNKDIVNGLNRAGARAVGLSGKDGMLLEARKRELVVTREDAPPEIIDLGNVGQVTRVNDTLIRSLIRDGFVPVIAPVGVDDEGHTYNINADSVAGTVAGALRAKRLLMLTDVAGLLDKSGELITGLNAAQAKALQCDGTISGGMIPKIECCLSALAEGVDMVTIVDGRVENCILLELLTDRGIGTALTL